MAGMRGHLVHAYDLVDWDEVWKTAVTDIPKLLGGIKNCQSSTLHAGNLISSLRSQQPLFRSRKYIDKQYLEELFEYYPGLKSQMEFQWMPLSFLL